MYQGCTCTNAMPPALAPQVPSINESRSPNSALDTSCSACDPLPLSGIPPPGPDIESEGHTRRRTCRSLFFAPHKPPPPLWADVPCPNSAESGLMLSFSWCHCLGLFSRWAANASSLGTSKGSRHSVPLIQMSSHKTRRTDDSPQTCHSARRWETPPCLCVLWEGRTARPCRPCSQPCIRAAAMGGYNGSSKGGRAQVQPLTPTPLQHVGLLKGGGGQAGIH